LRKAIRAGKAADVKTDIEVQNFESRVFGKESSGADEVEQRTLLSTRVVSVDVQRE
jgi:hypothetical protein